jgi:chromosome segregation ATPase
MSSTIDILTESSLVLSKQEPLTIREKIVNLFQELEEARDEQRRVNTELIQEIQARIDAEKEVSHLNRQVQLVEVNLDQTTNRVNYLTKQLIEVVKVSETARQYGLIFFF